MQQIGHRMAWAMAFLIMAAVLAAGCGKPAGAPQPTAAASPSRPAAPAPASFPLSVQDDLGRQVTIPVEPRRIVSLAPSNTEILFALGLGDRVVGVTKFCDYPEAAKLKEKVGGFQDVDVEKVVRLRPDLVLATGGVQQPVLRQLEKLGLTVYAVDAKSLEDVLDDISAIGRVTGAEGAAEALRRQLQERLRRARDRAARATSRPKVFFEIWPDPLITAGPGSFAHDLVEAAGGENIAADTAQPYPQFSLETLLARNPDVIVTPFAQSAADLKQGRRRNWEQIRAVREGRVILVDENEVSRPGPRLFDALERLVDQMHPELAAGN